jgi:type I restriction enzyme S subunit
MVMRTLKKSDYWIGSEFGPVPRDWQVLKALDFQPFITSGSRDWARYYSELGCPFIRITNLSHDDIYPDLTDLRFVDVTSGSSEAARTTLRPGDVLISITADIGAIGYIDNKFPLPAYINQHIACLRLPNGQIHSRYVAYFLASEASQYRFRSLLDVGAKSGLNLTAIANLKLLLPPLGEQREIAKVLSDADALIASLEALITKKCAIKEGAMQSLLSGRRRVPGFSGKWKRRSFGEVFDFLPTATNSRSDLSDEGSAGYVHYGDIHTLFHDSLDFGRVQVPRIDLSRCPNAALLKNGDWIMTDVSEDFDGVGKSVEVTGLKEKEIAVAGLHTFLLREKQSTFAPGFKAHLGSATELRTQYRRVMTGMKVFGVSKAALRDLVLPIPDWEEQKAIVAVLNDMNEDIRSFIDRLSKVRLIKEGLMQELLTGRVRLL